MKELNKARIIISILIASQGRDFFSKKDNIYVLLLLLDRCGCLELENLKEINITTNKKLQNYLKQAEEKILINTKFRDKYFNLEDNIKSIT
ncbi:MAG: hypothetical protein RR620_10715 [Clostridium sp.]